ncbi:MAG TPA: hypothetical protein VFQ68_30960 [Streptosporangiaceae bacterium]|nr:hypothetical protein [Streptosporangiaceae bacterium]
MTAEDWEAWCDATAIDDEPPPGLGWDDEEDEEPGLAPGEQVAWSAGFAKGAMAEGLPGGSELAFLADVAAGLDDRCPGATDGELDGVIAAWDRVEAHASARKHLAIAEFIRRRPEQGCEPEVPGGMPGRWDEFAADELRVLLAESKAAVERMMGRLQAKGHDPGVKLRHLAQIRHATCTSPVCRRPRQPVRLRTQHPLRKRWQNVLV